MNRRQAFMMSRQRVALPGARSFLQTEAALADNQAPTGRLFNDPYLDCRFSPFTRMAERGSIPDGRGKNVLVRDWKLAYDFEAVGGGFTIRIDPVFPFPVKVYQAKSTGITLSVDGAIVSSDATSVLPGGVALRGIPVTDQPDVVNESVSAARLVSLGYRLVYTGKAAECSGLFLTDDTEFKLDTVTRTTPYEISWVKHDGTAGTNVAANTVASAILDFTPLNNVRPSVYQLVSRPENGVQGVLKYQESASNHLFKPWHERSLVPISDTETVDAAITKPAAWASTSSTYRPFIRCIDDSLMSVNITAPPGMFRLEIAYCMEQELALSSGNLDMAKPSPELEPGKLLLADRVNSLSTPRTFQDPLLDLPMANLSIRGQRRRRAGRAKTQNAGTPRQPFQGQSKSARRRRNRRRRQAAQSCGKPKTN